MKLERLEIIHLPGLSSGFSLEGLAGDINLITGPNAIGKSSLVRALGLLLREPRNNDPLVTLAADFRDRNKNWRVERTGQQIEWKCDGVPAARPNLPSADQLSRYCLSMEDLIKADSTDKSLAQELQRSLRGGFDLDAVRTDIGKRHGLTEEKQLVEAQSLVREAERTADSLRDVQKAIPQLDAEIAMAQRAQQHVLRTQRAEQLLEAVQARKTSQEELERFPKNMKKLTGQELDSVGTLRLRLETSEDRRREHERALQQAQASLEGSGLRENDLEEAGKDLKAAEKKLRHVEVLQNELALQQDRRTEQKATLDTAADALGGSPPPNLDMASLERAEGFAGNLLKLREEHNQLTTRIGLLGDAPDEQVVRDHQKAVNALRNWLDAQPGEPDNRRHAVPLWASLLLAVASALGFVYAPPIVPVSLFLLLLLALGLTLRNLYRTSSKTAKARQKAAIQQFEETGIAAPNWSLSPVRDRLVELEESLGRLAGTRHMAEGADAARARLSEVDTELREIQEKQEQLADTIGFDPLIPITALDRFINLAKDWDNARTELEVTTRKLADLLERIEEALGEAKATLSRWQADMPPEADLDRLSAACESFTSKLEVARGASADIKLARQGIAGCVEESAHHREDLAKIYQGVGLSEDQHHVLFELSEQRASWSEAREKLREAEARERQLRGELEGEHALLELVDNDDESSLKSRLLEQQQLAERLEGLRDKRSQSDTDIRSAESNDVLGDAIANRVEAQAKLEQKRDELLTHNATDLLLNRVEEAYRATHEPEVLTQADALFRQVTANDFELELGDGGEFQARDTRQSVVRSLDELSVGTRMQLLLAVRLAWVRIQSADGKMLPLFLDEALTTSDERRFMVVAKSLDRVSSSSGIQIIYLSARKHEQGLWRAAIGRAPHSIDLAELRGQSDGDHAPEFEVTPSESIPRPKGGALEYAKELRVPGIDPALDAGEIHLFHLLRDDLDLLYQMMDSLRIRTLGQLESYIDHSARVEHHGRPEFSKLKDRCRSARAWISAWRQGRGRPVDALELEASGAFSRRYLAEATTLARTEPIDRDAHRFLAVLREGALKGFQTKKIDDFEAWLTLQDCLDDHPILSTDQRRQVVLREYDLENRAKLEDIGQCIDWLESALQQTK